MGLRETLTTTLGGVAGAATGVVIGWYAGAMLLASTGLVSSDAHLFRIVPLAVLGGALGARSAVRSMRARRQENALHARRRSSE